MIQKNKKGGNAFLKNSDNIFVQSNRLVEAHYKESLTQWEMFLFSKMCAMISPEDVDFKPYKIFIKDVLDYLDVQRGGHNYKYVIDAAHRLLERRITIYYLDDDNKKIAVDTHLVTSVSRLAEPAEEDNENLYVSLMFPPELKRVLLQLKDNFTVLDLDVFKFLKTPTSVRLHQILTSHLWKKDKKVEFDLLELKKLLGISDKYKQFGPFRTYILDDCQQKFEENANFSFTYKTIKSGKKVTTITFYLSENSKTEFGQLRLSQKIEPADIIVQETPKINEHLVVEFSPIVVSKFGVSQKVFADLIENFTEGVIRQAIKVTENAIKTKKIENIAGFFVEAVRGHFTETAAQEKVKQVEKKIALNLQEKNTQDSQKIEQQRQKYERKRKILSDLISTDSNFLEEILSSVKYGMVGQYYNSGKSLEQNMQSPLFAAAFLNAAELLKPDKFSDV